MLIPVLFILVLLLLTHRVWMMPPVQPVLASLLGVRYSQEHALAMDSSHYTFAFTIAYALQTCGESSRQYGAMHSGQHNSLDAVLASSQFGSPRIWSTRLKRRKSNAIRDKPCGSSRRCSPSCRHCEAEERGCGSLKLYESLRYA